MKRLKHIFVLGLALLIVPAMHAKEGADQYPYGAENWFAGALPPAGLHSINYFGYYTGEEKCFRQQGKPERYNAIGGGHFRCLPLR